MSKVISQVFVTLMLNCIVTEVKKKFKKVFMGEFNSKY